MTNNFSNEGKSNYASPVCEFHTVGDIVSTSYALPIMPFPREQDQQIEVDGD